MTLPQILADWNYEVAVRWYLAHGDGVLNPVLKFKTSVGEQLLREKLNALWGAEHKSSERQAPPPVRKLPDNIPQELQELEWEWRKQYKLGVSEHSELFYAKSDEERKELAFTILNRFKTHIIPAWATRDYFMKHKKMPPKDPDFDPSNFDVSKYTAEQLARRERNLATYISRDRKKGNDEKVKRWTAELEAVRRALREIPKQ